MAHTYSSISFQYFKRILQFFLKFDKLGRNRHSSSYFKSGDGVGQLIKFPANVLLIYCMIDAPDFWNQLPYVIRSCSSKDIFAGRLKTHLFSLFVNDPMSYENCVIILFIICCHVFLIFFGLLFCIIINIVFQVPVLLVLS